MGKDIELAILFADVVGSTRLYELMGDLRARDMVAICIDVMRSATEQRQGTVIKTMGDEVMSTFPSADEALNAAAQMQQQISSHAEPGQGGSDHHHGGDGRAAFTRMARVVPPDRRGHLEGAGKRGRSLRGA